MHWFNMATVFFVVMLVGVEFSVSAFENPAARRLEPEALSSVGSLNTEEDSYGENISLLAEVRHGASGFSIFAIKN